MNKKNNKITTVNNGYLGSYNDEERSKMRYVMWIAELSESSSLWTHIALLWKQEYICLSVIHISIILHEFNSLTHDVEIGLLLDYWFKEMIKESIVLNQEQEE